MSIYAEIAVRLIDRFCRGPSCVFVCWEILLSGVFNLHVRGDFIKEDDIFALMRRVVYEHLRFRWLWCSWSEGGWFWGDMRFVHDEVVVFEMRCLYMRLWFLSKGAAFLSRRRLHLRMRIVFITV